MAAPLGMRMIFTRSFLVTAKAAALTFFSSIKTQALCLERFLTDAAPSPERLTQGRVGQRCSSIRRSKGLIFHSQPAGLQWARVGESRIALTVELPGPTRPGGRPQI